MRYVIALLLLNCMVLVSCKKHHLSRNDTTNDRIKAAAQKLNATVFSTINDRAKADPGSRFDFGQFNELKSEFVTEIYISVNSVIWSNEDIMNKNSSIIALLEDNDNNREVWEVWPVPRRLGAMRNVK